MHLFSNLVICALLVASYPAAESDQNKNTSNNKSEYKTYQLKRGKWLFEKHCSACHGKNGAGVVGPNLTDWYFLHGSSRKDMIKNIRQGVVSKGMPAWDPTLSKGEIHALTHYVWGLRGKEIKGKAPQGTLLKKEDQKK